MLVGQKIVHGGFRGFARIARAKLLAGFAGRAPAPELHHHVFGVRDQFFAHLDDVRIRHAQTHSRRQTGTEQLIDQDAAVLRVILELDNVVVAVRATHQVRLRAAAHAPYLLKGSQHTSLSNDNLRNVTRGSSTRARFDPRTFCFGVRFRPKALSKRTEAGLKKKSPRAREGFPEASKNVPPVDLTPLLLGRRLLPFVAVPFFCEGFLFVCGQT